ncbi:hypothetical protein, partial [Dialister hominis]|uniref:hypothetical protein n=1 Tax=Dialister hominis TaxID=2582419 RepID=UPI003AB63F1A
LVLLFFIVKNYNTKGSAPDQMIRGRALFVGMNFVTSPFCVGWGAWKNMKNHEKPYNRSFARGTFSYFKNQ